MLERIQHIRGVGPFVEFKVGDHHDLRIAPLTVVYAHHGRGKSTLADVLRSLGTGDPTVFRARRRLGASSEPGATFRVQGKQVAFAAGAWTGRASIEVFDETFVNDNIYSGFDVGIDHLRNLARLVIGEKGVVFAKKSDALAKEIQELQIKRRKLGEAIQPKIEGMEISTFCGLRKVADVETAIATAEKTVARLSAAESIRTRATFTPSSLRQIEIEKLDKFLATTVATISLEARRAVESQTKALGAGAEVWLAEGLRFGARPTCPFCTQPTGDERIIDQYEAYFGKQYADHKGTLAKARSQLEGLYGPDAQKRAILGVAAQETLRAFWSQHVAGVPPQALPAVDLDAAWTEAYVELARLLDAKRSAPLDVIAIDAPSKSKLAHLSVAICNVTECVEALVKLNPEIERVKEETETVSVSAAKAEVVWLRNARTRHSAAVAENCDGWIALSGEIKTKTDAKATAKTELEMYSEGIFGTCAKRVNGYLILFAAGFRITGLKGSFEAGKSGSRFSIALTDVTGVSIDAGERTGAEPCVGNVLSTGDRFSLALAFFLAQFPEKGPLAGRCVVFDDPISSLDEHRRGRTKEAICTLVERKAQVIILSHYPVFLAEVHAAAPCKEKNALQLERVGSRLELQTWAVDEENLETFHRLRSLLRRFATENLGEADHIGTRVCGFLEAYIRVIDPERLPYGKWLGEYVKAVHARAAAGAPVMPPQRLKSLDRLTGFFGSFRHDATSTGIPPSRHPDDVKEYVREALVWVDPDKDWS